MTEQEMIDQLVPDIAEGMCSSNPQAFLEYYVRQELDDLTPETIKELYSDKYAD